MPLAVVVAGANRNDFKLFEDTFAALRAERPAPSAAAPQHLCLDKGYDFEEVRQAAAALGFAGDRLHLKERAKRGAKQAAKTVSEPAPAPALPPPSAHPARRWVVERTHSWMNRFRRILVRWEKKAANYEAMLHFACAAITLRRNLFG